MLQCLCVTGTNLLAIQNFFIPPMFSLSGVPAAVRRDVPAIAACGLLLRLRTRHPCTPTPIPPSPHSKWKCPSTSSALALLTAHRWPPSADYSAAEALGEALIVSGRRAALSGPRPGRRPPRRTLIPSNPRKRSLRYQPPHPAALALCHQRHQRGAGWRHPGNRTAPPAQCPQCRAHITKPSFIRAGDPRQTHANRVLPPPPIQQNRHALRSPTSPWYDNPLSRMRHDQKPHQHRHPRLEAKRHHWISVRNGQCNKAGCATCARQGGWIASPGCPISL